MGEIFVLCTSNGNSEWIAHDLARRQKDAYTRIPNYAAQVSNNIVSVSFRGEKKNLENLMCVPESWPTLNTKHQTPDP